MPKRQLVEATAIRLSRPVYMRLLQVKGIIMARKGENISLDETVEELIKTFMAFLPPEYQRAVEPKGSG